MKDNLVSRVWGLGLFKNTTAAGFAMALMGFGLAQIFWYPNP